MEVIMLLSIHDALFLSLLTSNTVSNYFVLGAVQLTGGTNRFNGRVQAFENGKWYNLCNDNWTNKNLEVTCRQLGTSGKENGNEANPNAYYFTVDFQCGGTEEYLFKCTYSNYRSCSSNAIVVVTCVIPVSPRNGRCDIDLQETCGTTLTCQDVNGFGRCICGNDSFWDENTNKCEKSKYIVHSTIKVYVPNLNAKQIYI
ncbi:deleted in malignant brain tumors 1 protein-like [Mizuhopecten yessoensis]|uniref:deleted in malignant brain tumors 1 protein-like n=1 Tax=Mizuhopecten yessoensis TaxID=6573 RepID=UPI000B45D2CE|nr:deleted in malignant brain tumors 1 protein-like [Mizuhopecten yessoensis]